jgi:phage tail sheath protein FI
VTWTPVAKATGYTLEEAADPTFTAPATLYNGTATTYRVWRRGDGVYFFRVRAEYGDQAGPWSNSRWVEPDARQGWAIKKATIYGDGDLLAIQRALIRFSAARADIVALLTLPAHYREDEALTHVEALLAQTESKDASAAGGKVLVRPISFGEGSVHSYAALFHPWVMIRVEDAAGATTIRKIPPDGPVCGTIAARAINRGAWVAPANEAIEGIVALDPAIDRQGWARLFARQVNLVRQDPRGFMLLSAETLSPDSLLQPINVRRLLILLRRLAIREGMTYVFEPNNEAFWRLVRHRFEQLLAYLYTRGAFAGTTPDQAFRVVTGSSINTPESLDQGRFIIELRVAPSRPLTFLTVRLVQTDRQGLSIREVN